MAAVQGGTEPVFSLVIPCYNLGSYASECLESVRAQTFENFEVVCVDDGSTDGTAALLDEWALRDARFNVLHQGNAGVSAARNLGLDAVTGMYVLFVDGDDLIEPTALERIARAAGVLHPATEDLADIVVFGGVSFPTVPWIDRVMETRDIVRPQDPDDNGFRILCTECGCIPLMANKAYRTAFLRRLGARFNVELALGEDNAFQCLVFPEAERVVFVRDKLYRYRCGREGSAISKASSDDLSKLRRHIFLLRYIVDEWLRKGYSPEAVLGLVDAQYYLFDDEVRLQAEPAVTFCTEFSAAFADLLHEEVLAGLPRTEARFRYRYFFDVADLALRMPAKVAVRKARLSRRLSRVKALLLAGS